MTFLILGVKRVFIFSVGRGVHDCANLENFRGPNTSEGEVHKRHWDAMLWDTDTAPLFPHSPVPGDLYMNIYLHICMHMHICVNICTVMCSLLPCSWNNCSTGRSNWEALISQQLATQVHVLADVWSFAVKLLAFSCLPLKPLANRDAVTILFWCEEQRQPSCHLSPVTSADHSEAQ